jgi:hypothetical protein
MADTPNGETATQGDSQTTVPTPAAPVANASDPAEVERLRKEAEQATLRANQLANQLKAKEDAEEKARQAALEEQNEWKTIAEQEKAKRLDLEAEQERAVAKIQLDESQTEVFKEFPDDVVELAKDTGLTLNENSEEAKEALKSKLNKLSERISSSSNVTPNNQATNTKAPDRNELLQEHAKQQTITPGDTPAYHKALGGLNWIKVAKADNGEE